MPRHDPQAGGRNTKMPGQRFDDGLVGLAVLGTAQSFAEVVVCLLTLVRYDCIAR